MTLIACRDCAAIQRLKPLKRGRLECVRCGRVLENRTGRSLDGALACAIAVLLLLIPANTMTLMSVHLGPVTSSTVLASGLSVAWAQRWPLVSFVLALEAIILPFLRFSLLSVTLAAVRLGRHDKWLGRAFRYSELLDPWAMTDVLLIGGGIGYGRLAAETSVSIGVGGWCFVCVALLTMITRGTLERREVWRRLGSQPISVPPWAVACTGCDLLLPAKAVGRRCPRCAARIYRRRPGSLTMCAALLIATTVLTPIAYGYPMSEFSMGNHREPHSVVNGIILLFTSGFWYFGIIIFFVSLVFPLSKLVALTWFLTSIHRRSRWQLRLKMKVYRFIDEVGRWSTLDPFTVLVFAPMIQFGQLAHFDFMGGAAAFLATVVLSMFATLSLDPRLMWDAAAKERAPAPAAALKAST